MLKKTLSLISVSGGLLFAAESSAVTYDGITFPDGNVSFADALVSYEPLFGPGPGPTDPRFQDGAEALGAPDYTGTLTVEGEGAVSLGAGGRITLEFLDNFLTGSGDGGFDLHIFEIGADVEDTDVEISKDGSTWEAIGAVSGSTSSIDIDVFGFGPSDLFRFVRLTDVYGEGNKTGATVGADIDAVGAISTVINEDYQRVPDSGATALLLGAAVLGLVGLRRRLRA